MKPLDIPNGHHTTDLINGVIEHMGPLSTNTRLLIKLSAQTNSLTNEELKHQILLCLKAGITPSEIYQSFFSINDVIGLKKTIQILEITEKAIKEL